MADKTTDQLIDHLILNTDAASIIATNYPELKPNQHLTILERYFGMCLKQIINKPNIRSLIYVNLTEATNKTGEIRINKKRTRIWGIANKLLKFFNIAEVGNGYKQKLSEAVINEPYVTIIDEYLNSKPIQIIKPHKPTTTEAATYGLAEYIVDVEIDNEALDTIIRGNGYSGEVDKDGLPQFIQFNVAERAQLKRIQAIALTTGKWQNTYNTNKTGRYYGIGETMQTISKNTRNALLGDHQVLDYNSASYSVFLQIYKWIYSETGTVMPLVPVHVEQYVMNPGKIRCSVATEILNDYYIAAGTIDPSTRRTKRLKENLSKNSDLYKKVKGAFTSIGFGARTTSANSWWYSDGGKLKETAIKSSLGALTEQFFENDFIQNFVAEFKFMMETIFETLYSEGDSEIYPGVKLNRSNSRGKQYAMIYQSLERRLLDALLNNVNREEVICLLHDGILIKKQKDINYIKTTVADTIAQRFYLDTSFGSRHNIDTKNNIITLSHETKSVYGEATTGKQIEDAHYNHMQNEKYEAAIADYENHYA